MTDCPELPAAPEELNVPNLKQLVGTLINCVGRGELGSKTNATTSGTANYGICSVKLAEPVVVQSLLFTAKKIWGILQNDPNELLVKEAGLSPN